MWANAVATGTLTMSSIPIATTIHELVHIVGTTDDLAQILPMFRNSSGAVNVVGEIKSLILNVMMFAVFFAMNFVCSHFEQNCSKGLLGPWHNIPHPIFSVCSDLFHISGTCSYNKRLQFDSQLLLAQLLVRNAPL